ncbi:MAG: hypothetical protein KAY65_00965 [Planctomycetes bacterium]|nr:hypothetical protein [Planctomycetota bacterium]
MNSVRFTIIAVLCGLSFAHVSAGIAAEGDQKKETNTPTKVYVPYEELKGVFEKADQGVFLPYKEFQKLWRAAQGKPAGVSEAPFEYLVSTARFDGKVEGELATLRLELTIDILSDGWVQVPIGLGEVAVAHAATEDANVVPLLRVEKGQYIFVTKGKGRYVLALDFVRQLETQPGLAILSFRIPSAAITTLDLLIPEENLKVDVQPMLAATTSQVEVEGAKATKLQAFLGSAQQVRLSWKPKTEAAAELEAVIICEQFQHINIGEALISYETRLDYSIHRGGVDEFTVKLPGEFRITDVTGANIAKWEIIRAEKTAGDKKGQLLKVGLFSPAKGKYTLTIKTERFLQEAQAKIPLSPITTEQVLRRSGLIGITYSPRRSVHLEDVKNLARVDTGQLPKNLQSRPGVTAYRFITSDYSGTIAIETTSPRITVNQLWMLGADIDRLELRGKIHYKVERTGIFELNMNLPEPWKLESVEPRDLVDDYQLKGSGRTRILHILLKREKAGEFDLTLVARAERADPEDPVDFALPLADANDLQLYQGQLMLLLPNELQAQVEDLQQLQAIPLKQAQKWAKIAGLSPAMAFEFRAIDRDKPAGGKFEIDSKPVQISATVHRLLNIQSGSIEQEAVIQYRIRYAPIDTFYLKMPAELAYAGVDIDGANIKEKPRIDELPADQRGEPNDPGADDIDWAYYKIVLQSKVTDSYQLKVRTRRPFQAGSVGEPAIVEAEPILAAGRLSDQNGHIAIAKAETLAIGRPVSKNLKDADPGSPADLPYEPHRRLATLAFKYDGPVFALSLPVVAQTEATVFTTIVSGAIIEQVLARDGMLNTHATYLLATSQGDRLSITLPENAELTAVLLNGNEAATEIGIKPDERIVRLPPSAGQVSKFVLEISYGLKDVSARNLVAPALPRDIPVQQTLWRLWIPEDYSFLGYDRVFARLEPGQGLEMLRTLRQAQGASVDFKLSGQGKELHFVRQGAPGELSVLLVGKEVFSVVIWVLIIGAGALMLKLGGFHRVLVILAAGLIAGIIHLYLPLLVDKVMQVGLFAGILVLLLWMGQWAFKTLPQLREGLAARRQAASQKAKKAKERQPKNKTAQKPQPPDQKQQEQSKQDQE